MWFIMVLPYILLITMNLCDIAVLWCVPNSGTAHTEWKVLNSTSSGSMKLRLCAHSFSVNCYNCCSSSNDEGVYQCVQSYTYGSGVSSTLQFTHSVYNLNSEICPTQSSSVTQTPYLTSTIDHELKESSVYSSSNTKVDSSVFLVSNLLYSSYTSVLSSPYSAAIDCSIEKCSANSLLSTFSSISLSKVPPVPIQSSTVPHYTGIGLLVATNLLTIIALISSCVYMILLYLILVILVVMLSKRRKEEREEREREERYWITVMLLLINSLRNPLRTLSTINSNMISIHSLIVCTHSINFLCVCIFL